MNALSYTSDNTLSIDAYTLLKLFQGFIKYWLEDVCKGVHSTPVVQWGWLQRNDDVEFKTIPTFVQIHQLIGPEWKIR